MNKTTQPIKKYLIAGLLVWLPIWVTYVLIRFLVNMMDDTLSLLPAHYHPEQLLGMHLPGMGLVFTVLVIFITGLIATNFLGKKIFLFWERILSRIPLIRSIYSAVKQVAHALLQPKSNAFRKVLLVEYPRKGLWSIGFQTSDQNIAHPSTPETSVTVFIPTTPNPTSGFLIIAPKSDTEELDLSVEEALRMVISLGVVMPTRMKDEIQNKTQGEQHD